VSIENLALDYVSANTRYLSGIPYLGKASHYGTSFTVVSGVSQYYYNSTAIGRTIISGCTELGLDQSAGSALSSGDYSSVCSGVAVHTDAFAIHPDITCEGSPADTSWFGLNTYPVSVVSLATTFMIDSKSKVESTQRVRAGGMGGSGYPGYGSGDTQFGGPYDSTEELVSGGASWPYTEELQYSNNKFHYPAPFDYSTSVPVGPDYYYDIVGAR